MTTRLFLGVLPSGEEVLVTLFDSDLPVPGLAEVAFRRAGDTWGPPTELIEEM